MNLIIIGNGFDLEHGLETSYWNFREYLKEIDWLYLQSLEEMYGFWMESREGLLKEYLWRDFETNLSNIEESNIIEQGEYIDLGLEWEDIGIEDTLYEYWKNRYGFIEKLNNFVMSWIEQVNINVPRISNNINTEDLFITFNYTLLLEQVYGIDKYNILHIHGSIDKDDNSPVVGHGNKDKITEIEEMHIESRNNFNEKKSAICSVIANYYRNTLKDVNQFILMNENFFSRLSKVKSISIIGHSLGDVDMPYFKKIYESVNKDIEWNIYLYKDTKQNKKYNEDREREYKEKIISIGVNENNIQILDSKLFFKKIK